MSTQLPRSVKRPGNVESKKIIAEYATEIIQLLKSLKKYNFGEMILLPC